MRTLPLFLKASAVAGLAFAFAACQPGDTSKTSKTESLTYSFTVNGCETGKKTFSDLASYCQALLDDQANNYCAQNMRLEMYNQRCGSISSGQKLRDDLIPSVPSEQPTHPEITKEIEIPQQQEPTPETVSSTVENSPLKSARLPEVVTITARAVKPMEAFPKSAKEKRIVIFQSELIIESIEPKVEGLIRLGQPVRAKMVDDIGKCKTFPPKTSDLTLGMKLNFTVIGLDPSDQIAEDSCLTRLSTLATSGFEYEYQRVSVGEGDVLDLPKIDKVIFKVKAN